ncbi:L-Ala-D/L-amino acid epimerase isoform X3 [Cajanus cajan]|uniref:L-Ala-D/L-amino acid epimerase isoform X3 n=1 Tax=Cajanus cajan TaxID=3821 RepID=UPI00098DC72E|nr:L-Ala-D/L-amino acid epimerase isoform X3 [Cajanus cajan]
MVPILGSNMSQTLKCRTQHPMNSTLMKSLSHKPKNIPFIRCYAKKSGDVAKIMASATPTAAPITFGFRNLLETFTVDVHRAENRPLNVPLIAPFTIATSRLDKVENVAIRVELSNGAVGWGEAPILPFVTAEDQTTAMAKASEACAFLRRCPALTLGSMLGEIAAILPGHQFASVRAGVEMAIIDAVANSIRVPLWRLFGGASNTITTDITDMGLTPVLFEQPVHRDDWDGLRYVSNIARERYGVYVAADESCRSIDDVYKIAEGNLLDVINIKLAKVGVMGALEIIEKAKVAGLDLMIGGMVETRLAMGFAGQLAAGIGCFKFIDLDTPLLLADDPVLEGYEVSGATYKFTNARGHGGFLHWDNIAEY